MTHGGENDDVSDVPMACKTLMHVYGDGFIGTGMGTHGRRGVL